MFLIIYENLIIHLYILILYKQKFHVVFILYYILYITILLEKKFEWCYNEKFLINILMLKFFQSKYHSLCSY